MVSSLKTVEKPTLTGQKKPMKKETEKELTAKFGQLTEEEHVKAAFKVGKKLVSVNEACLLDFLNLFFCLSSLLPILSSLTQGSLV